MCQSPIPAGPRPLLRDPQPPRSPRFREGSINRRYARRCRQLGIIYADISLRVVPPKGGTLASGGTGWDGLPTCTLA